MSHPPKTIVQRMASASGWLMLDRFVRMGLGFAVSILIARYYGPEQWGMLSYVLASATLFGSVATAGGEDIILKDLSQARSPQEQADIQKTACILRLIFGALAYLSWKTTVRGGKRIESLEFTYVGPPSADATAAEQRVTSNMKGHGGTLEPGFFPGQPGDWVPHMRKAHGFDSLPITEDTTLTLNRLPDLHKDPFDRLLTAQALHEGLVLITPDPLIRAYPVRVEW